MDRPRRIFLLSPARTNGRRAQLVMSERAGFELAVRLRDAAPGVTIGEVFSFLSGLYFRGKLAYARRFAACNGIVTDASAGAGADRAPADRAPGGAGPASLAVHVITSDRGLVAPETPISLRDLRRWCGVSIDAANDRYRRPLLRDACALAATLPADGEAVLLGSIASDKYVSILLNAFGPRLKFPAEFVGRGDMSRGGLLLRASRSGEELSYIPVDGAVRHGRRPPRLAPLPRLRSA